MLRLWELGLPLFPFELGTGIVLPTEPFRPFRFVITSPAKTVQNRIDRWKVSPEWSDWHSNLGSSDNHNFSSYLIYVLSHLSVLISRCVPSNYFAYSPIGW